MLDGSGRRENGKGKAAGFEVKKKKIEGEEEGGVWEKGWSGCVKL